MTFLPQIAFSQSAQKYDLLRNDLERQLTDLIQWCTDRQFAGEAERTRQLLIQRDPNRQYFFVPPEKDPWPVTESESVTNGWARRLHAIRTRFAVDLFAIAVEQALAGSESASYALFHEVCTLDPEHGEARRILGYRKKGDSWENGPSEITSRKATSRHKLLNWWTKDGYQVIESPHYQIDSRADEAETKKLASQLERWRVVWRQAFFDYWSGNGTLVAVIKGKSPSADTRKHKVVFFADREEYLTSLNQLGVQGVEKSTGFYSDRHQTLFLYLDEPRPIETWSHEQAHQLFQESASARKDPVEQSHAWALEGIAMYYESLVDMPYVTALGGFDSGRLQYARVHWTREHFFVPFAQLNSLGREAFLTQPDVSKLYSQAAGMSHFLMSYEHGKYRPAMLQLVKLIYQRRARPDSLAKLCGVPLEQLQQEYKSFLTVERDNVYQFLCDPQRRLGLALGFSNIDDRVGPLLMKCPNLQWLQLSSTGVGDSVASAVGGLTALEQLFLDNTSISDAALKELSNLSQLEELDLADTRVTDAGLAAIGNLTDLKALWLGGTQITDAGLSHLSGLKNLQLLDIKRTAVTPAGLKRLQQHLPYLK